MKFAILDAHGNPIVVRDFSEIADLAKGQHASRWWQRARRKLIERILLEARDELLRELRSL